MAVGGTEIHAVQWVRFHCGLFEGWAHLCFQFISKLGREELFISVVTHKLSIQEPVLRHTSPFSFFLQACPWKEKLSSVALGKSIFSTQSNIWCTEVIHVVLGLMTFKIQQRTLTATVN